MFKDIFDFVGANWHKKSVKHTSFSFKLVTRTTVNILIGAALVILAKQIFGDPIVCDANKDIRQFIETKCWIEGVYLDDNLMNGTFGKDVTKWGVGPPVFRKNQKFINQAYYQWIVPVIAFMALLLYLPRVSYRSIENGVMEKLLKCADSPVILPGWNNKKNELISYLNGMKKSNHTFYAMKYFLSELVALVALVFNLFIMHHVFNDFWTSFTPAIIALVTENYQNFTIHSAKLFPTQAKCLYNNFGPSGSSQDHDALCFLPQNTVNEKIFVFFYFWFISVTIIQVFSCLYLSSMMFSKYLRKRHLHIMCNSVFSYRYNEFYSNYSHCGLWFALRLIHKNLGPILFKDLLEDLINPEKTKKKLSVEGGKISMAMENPVLA